VHQLDELRKTTFTTTSYNYTEFDIYNISYKDASVPFDILDSVDGGSIFFRNSNKFTLDNGERVTGGGETCCLIWSKPTDKPLRIRVVWSVIYDLESFDGKLNDRRDKRSFKSRGRGSAWCEAIIDVVPARENVQADKVIFHFLPDGEVYAQLGTLQTEKPLPSAFLAKHRAPLSEGQFCRTEINNPFYNVPRAPHRE